MRRFSGVRDLKLNVSARILERGKKKEMARKERGMSQSRILFSHGDANNTKKYEFLCVFLSPWLGEGVITGWWF